jgi:hypothetical protein
MSEAIEQLTKRQIAERCLTTGVETLLQLAEEVAGHPVGPRLEILLASILRAVRCGAAIQSLYVDLPYSEEMHTLLRSLAELVINASYLQIATPEELNSYLKYDAVMTAKTMRRALDFRSDALDYIPKDRQETLRKHGDEVREEIKDTISKTSWTKTDIHRRAVKLDEEFKCDIFRLTSTIIYSQGHVYIHSTYSSLTAPIVALRTGERDVISMRREADDALYGASQVLYLFSRFICTYMQIEVTASIGYVNSLIGTYYEAPSVIVQ